MAKYNNYSNYDDEDDREYKKKQKKKEKKENKKYLKERKRIDGELKQLRKRRKQVDDNLILEVMKVFRKKGKLKKYAIKGKCFHHRIDKNGRLDPYIEKEPGGLIRCQYCKEEFQSSVHDQKEIKKAVKTLLRMVNQAKFLSCAAATGKPSMHYLAQLNAMLLEYPKVHKRINDVTTYDGQRRQQEKEHKRNAPMGTWRMV